MSTVNIKRAIENIRVNTSIYSPIVELVVNALQAIDDRGSPADGRVSIQVRRSNQIDIEGALPEVVAFSVTDNGVGFTDEHRESFDTLYTDCRIAEGGKGFGRFICLKYFDNLDVDSHYLDGATLRRRRFSMGTEQDIIVNEKVLEPAQDHTGTSVYVHQLKTGRSFDKELATIARHLVERLLPYFIDENYVCPEVVLIEQDDSESICLNQYCSNELASIIREITPRDNRFILTAVISDEEFYVRVFKLYFPGAIKSKVSLVAHRREVTGSTLHNFVPEFSEEFFESTGERNNGHERNYIVKAYVFSRYLEQHVVLERTGFEFQKESDLLFGISQNQIESKAAAIAMEAVGTEITSRKEKKRVAIQRYVDDEAPWHKELLKELDISAIPYNPSNEQIESQLHTVKFAQETEIKAKIHSVLAESSLAKIKDTVPEIVRTISSTSKNDLIHYIALRRNILDLFAKSLEVDETGVHESEGIVHDIIFPRRKDSEQIPFEHHNLWIIDERLNFTNYVSSDKPLSETNVERPDLLGYDRRVLFRGDNEPSNPVSIFEFKRPQRDDFVNPGAREDPVQQIIRYVNDIRNGRYSTPEGRPMRIEQNTPFYGYVVCDLTYKVENWLHQEKNFKPMPDRLGWFNWVDNINLYVEVLSWDKLIRDARMRNQIFFQKLGI